MPLSKYDWTVLGESSPAADSVFKLAKARFPALPEAEFAEFAKAMLTTHGKDLHALHVGHLHARPRGLRARRRGPRSGEAREGDEHKDGARRRGVRRCVSLIISRTAHILEPLRPPSYTGPVSCCHCQRILLHAIDAKTDARYSK